MTTDPDLSTTRYPHYVWESLGAYGWEPEDQGYLTPVDAYYRSRAHSSEWRLIEVRADGSRVVFD